MCEPHQGLEESLHATGECVEALDQRAEHSTHTTNDGIKHDTKVAIGNRAQDHGPRKTSQCTDQTHCPEDTAESSHAKGLAAHVHDHDLAADHDRVDAEEPVVSAHAFKDIEVVIEASVVEFIEDLHPHEGVEYHCGELLGSVDWVGIVKVGAEKLVSGEVEHECYGQLVDCLAEDHLPHGQGKKRGTLWHGLSIENLFGWGVSSSVSQC